MRVLFGAVYWLVVGILAIVVIYVSVFGTLPPYFLLVVLGMSVLGAWWPGPRYSWAALAGFGMLPALLLTNVLLGWIAAANWSCSRIEFGAVGSPYGDCSIIAGELIVTTAVFWAITLSGVALLYLLLRSRPRPDARGARAGAISDAIGLGLILLVVVGATGLSVMKMMAPPSPPEKAGLPPNGLPVSCSEGEEDIGVFNGVGDYTTPSFETIGEGWRYVYNSTGSGAFSIEALDEDGNTVPSSTVSNVAGGEGRSPRLEAQGTFSLKIDADDGVGHTVRACDETDPSGRNRVSVLLDA